MAKKPNHMSADEWRERCKLRKRASRAKRYAAGLNCAGLVSLPKFAKLGLSQRLATVHPTGCPCYDCLYPALEPAAAIEAQVAINASRRMVRA